jgi:hypothetical protein
MTDTRLYLAMTKMPTFAALVGILVNLVQIGGIRTEVAGLRGEINGLRSEFNGLRGEFRGEVNSLRSELKGEINSLRAGLDLLTGKVIELVDRVSRLEAKIEK